MADADRPAPKPSGRRKAAGPKSREVRTPRKAAASPDPLEADFGPEFEPEAVPPEDGEAGEAAEAPGDRGAAPAPGIFPGVACGGEGCLLYPFANLLGKFGLRLVRGHGASLSRVAFSSIELMRALRDFLDEEIALVEKAAGAGGGESPRYEKIPLD